ncbi:hypothetical protein GCM10009827_064960 [Dactylosporangium maewongense]|uniref:Uncharacterized protein n=1 Tax=Dactylosporangium maewongense TaxID=634393 RepID=A0ABN2BDH8_9ACTN
MKTGAIDAFFFSGGLPTGGVTDLSTTSADKVQLRGLPPERDARCRRGRPRCAAEWVGTPSTGAGPCESGAADGAVRE